MVESAYRGDSARRGWTHEADLLDGERITAAELASVLANPAQRVLVAEGTDGFHGCVAVTDLGASRAYLGMFAVAPERQAGGLGRRLIAAAEDCARRTFGATVLEMTVIARRTELIAWYERRGYQRTGEQRPFIDPARDDLSFVVLARALA